MEGLKARRGDLSGPVLAILVTLILLAIGAVIIAYFTLFAGPAPTPVLVVKDQPIAYNSTTGNKAVVEVVVANIGTAQVTLKSGSGGTNLTIVGPSGLVTALGEAGKTVTYNSPTPPATIAPGSSVTLKFEFGTNSWNHFKLHRSASARLLLIDTAGNTIGQFEVSIRIIGGG